MGIKKGIITLILLMAFSISNVVGSESLDNYEDINVIVVNSKSWQDVYTALLTGRLIDVPVFFVRNQEQGVLLVDNIGKERNVLLLENAQGQYIKQFDLLLINKGHSVRKYRASFDLNKEIYNDISVRDLIIVDDTLGYDAVSVAPYAVQQNAYVLFANDENIGELIDIINQKAETILLYGDLDRIVFDEFNNKDVEIINEGGRFSDNIRIVTKFLNNSDQKSIKFTNGEFVEKSLFNGDIPVLFIGKTSVPEETKRYIVESDIKFVTIVGNDLVPLATSLKGELENKYQKELGMVALIGKSQTGKGSGDNQINVLDTFSIPIYDAQIMIESVFYNELAGELSVTYKNLNDLKIYFISTITFEDEDSSWGDNGTQFLDGSKTKTINYKIPLDSDVEKGEILTLFGMSEKTFERQLLYNIESLERLEIMDDSDIEILEIGYDKLNNAFKIKYKNIGPTEVFIDTELIDVIVDGETQRISSNRVISIGAGKTKISNVRAKLSSLDVEENFEVEIKAYFGMRENTLFKTKSAILELKSITSPVVYTVIIVLVVIMVLLYVLRKKQKK
jgi:hypothetical protein